MIIIGDLLFWIGVLRLFLSVAYDFGNFLAITHAAFSPFAIANQLNVIHVCL